MAKKITIFLLLLGLISILTTPTFVSAADSNITTLLNKAAGTGGAGYNTSEEVGKTGLASIAGILIRGALSLLGVIFVSYTIYGGFLWMTAAGSEEKVTKAKNIIRDGIIGLIITLSAFAIYAFIATYLLGGGTTGSGNIETSTP